MKLINFFQGLKAKINFFLRNKLIYLTTLDELKENFSRFYFISPQIISTPEALSMPFYHDAKHLQNKTYLTPDLYTINLQNVIYSSDYHILLTKSREILTDSISTQKNKEQFSIKNLYFSKELKLSGYYAVFKSHKNEYYHTLIDNLPRLYLLNQPDYKALQNIRLLCSERLNQAETFFLDKLLPENVSLFPVASHQLLLLENLIFPTFLTRRFAGYLPSQYINWFLEKVLPKRPRNKKNRIFISRVATERGKLRCILNEDDLFEQLKLYGFKKYILEHLSPQEQIELFYDAEFVIGTHGAGLSNIIFSEKIQIIELFPIPCVVPHYYYLAKSLGHIYQYWCSQEPYRDSNFLVNILEVTEIVKRTINKAFTI
jgi:capsular polysaccharide biosynthesis protein